MDQFNTLLPQLMGSFQIYKLHATLLCIAPYSLVKAMHYALTVDHDLKTWMCEHSSSIRSLLSPRIRPCTCALTHAHQWCTCLLCHGARALTHSLQYL